MTVCVIAGWASPLVLPASSCEENGGHTFPLETFFAPAHHQMHRETADKQGHSYGPAGRLLGKEPAGLASGWSMEKKESVREEGNQERRRKMDQEQKESEVGPGNL